MLAPILGANDHTAEYMPPPLPAETDAELFAVEEEAKPDFNTEDYDHIQENDFKTSIDNPLSTFSIDVDYASYSNARRFLMNGNMPPADAVRIEEFINYFSYEYPEPDGAYPFSVSTEMADCPWNDSHKLVQIGLKGKSLPKEDMPPTNLVFLLDVSGSMSDYNKLPLLQKSFRLLTNQLRAEDRVSIVVYAGASGVVLEPTPGNEKVTILEAIDNLEAGGSTAGAEGIELAYKLAEENLMKDGNNRIILATDGDFNVGPSSDGALVRLIEKKREKGIFLSVLGFGMGNYKDNKMEKLADNGNGNYAYIDNIQEARKVLVNEITSTLFTIAKDVKIQVEFNPSQVKEYRLIGYENRLLANEDFNDDKKDAGEIGAGHTVTALYEIIPVNATDSHAGKTDPLKYQKREVNNSDEWMTIKLRYKQPDADESQLLSVVLKDEGTPLAATSDNFRFAASVAGFGMLLRDSKYKGDCTYQQVIDLAKNSKGADKNGYRAEYINLVGLARDLTGPVAEGE